jgi:Protein of unknown function (DUF3108)
MPQTRSGQGRQALRLASRLRAITGVMTLIVALCVETTGATSGAAPLPFQAGEELIYEVSWLGIGVGRASMRIELPSSAANQTPLRLVSLARTKPVIDTFYKVEDRVESLFDPATRTTRFFRIRQREGSYRSFREITFEPSKGRVIYQKNDKAPRVIELDAMVQDPLSILYAVRAMPLSVGQSVRMSVFDRGEVWDAEVRILERERLQLPMGAFNTLKVQPILREASIFRKKGEMFVWLTDDAQHVPVQMRSTIMIGAVQAQLIEAKGITLTADGATAPPSPLR